MPDPDVIRFPCPRCGKALKVAASAAGKRARCTGKACGQRVTVPAAGPGPEPAEEKPEAEHEGFIKTVEKWLLWPCACVLVVHLIAWVCFVVWLFQGNDPQGMYIGPAIAGGVLIPIGLFLVVLRLVPDFDRDKWFGEVRELLEKDHAELLAGKPGRRDEIAFKGTLTNMIGGAKLMRDCYLHMPKDRLKEVWKGIGGWPDSYADPVVDEMVDLLEADEREARTRGGFGHGDRLRELGRELDGFGGIDLMRKAYDRVRQRGVYFSQDIWHMIGEWRE